MEALVKPRYTLIAEGEPIPEGVSFCVSVHCGKEVMAVYLKSGGRVMRAYFRDDGETSMGIWFQDDGKTRFDFLLKADGSLIPENW